MPGELRASVEAWLGSAVVEARTQHGGFSPGVAARLRCADDRRVFLKAVSSAVNPESPSIHRREALVTAAMPTAAPVPRLLEWWDREADLGWVVLALEDIDGVQPTQPWEAQELARVLEAVDELGRSLTPSPVDARIARRAEEWEVMTAGFWRRIAERRPAGLDEWSARNARRLIAVEAGAAEAVKGETLLHCDLRADNILLTPERVWFVDWPWARIGAPWVDLAGMAPSVAMQGGPPASEFLAQTRIGQSATPDQLAGFVAALAGYFVWQSLQPAPPGLPTLRKFQAAQGVAAIEWLAGLAGE